VNRQPEVDQAVRQLFVSWQEAQDDRIRKEVHEIGARPLARTLTLPEVRRALDVTVEWTRPRTLAYFERAMRLAQSTTARWGGALIVVMLPPYSVTTRPAWARAHYESVAEVSRALGLRVVDGDAAFRAHGDPMDLYQLGIDNHPNERGHAVLAQAILAQMGTGVQK
jgi:hypothetical protein